MTLYNEKDYFFTKFIFYFYFRSNCIVIILIGHTTFVVVAFFNRLILKYKF